MIVFPAMHSTFNHLMQCLGRAIPLKCTGIYKTSERSEREKSLGVSRILAYVKRTIGAPCRDMTQIGWQV